MYRNMAKYYDSIFPSAGKHRFLMRLLSDYGIPAAPKLLDIGCSNGRLALMLARSGCDVTAFDLSSAMIAEARHIQEKSQCQDTAPLSGSLELLELNMLNVTERFPEETFDCAYCVGNTLVHLPDDESILQALTGFAKVLKPAGILVIQVLPYASLLEKRPAQLPLIDNEVLRFERHYDYEDSADSTSSASTRIHFHTRLLIKETGENWEGTEILYPITETTLKALLRHAGLRVSKTYGSFAGDALSETSPALILVCEKVENTL